MWQGDSYGSAGLWGYRLVFGGAVLATFGQIWDYVLFDPWVHPMHGGGFMLQMLAILMFFIGFPLWAIVIWRARKLAGWQRAIPVLWIFYAIGLFYTVFGDDPSWLYPMYGIDIGFIADIFWSISFLLV
ncbi:MAG: hypothetical protein N2D54_05285, partial [Chloroflexota bacterium]